MECDRRRSGSGPVLGIVPRPDPGGESPDAGAAELLAAFPPHPDDPFARLILRGDEVVGSLELDFAEGLIILSRIFVEEWARGSGVGRDALKAITAAADRAGAAVILETFWRGDVEGGGRLAEWYGRNGFVAESGPDESGLAPMRRACAAPGEEPAP